MSTDATARPARENRPSGPKDRSDPNPTIFLYERDAKQQRLSQQLLVTTGFNVDAVEDAGDLLTKLGPEDCGCVVTDLYLGDRSAAQLCVDLKRDGVGVPVIVTSEHRDPENAVQTIQAGAFDFLAKPYSSIRLLDAVYRAVQCSQRSFATRRRRYQLDQRYRNLTDRERQILQLVVDGLPNKAIAMDLSISQRTVETHRQHLMQKLGASSLAELVRIAVVLNPEVLDPLALAS